MKRLLKFKKQKSLKLLAVLSLIVIVASSVVIPISLAGEKTAKAATVDELRAQSSSLQQQIDINNQRIQELASQADTLQNKLAILNAQILQLRTQIDLTNAKINELQVALDQAQIELDRQKNLLKASLQALYKKGGASTVELLVGSDSFSQFINDQTYLEKLKASIQVSTEKVIELKQQIQAQQDEQKVLLSQQQSEQTSLNMTRAEQQNLLNETQGQESAYQQTTSELRRQQAQVMADIAAQLAASGVSIYTGDGSNGGYPTVWANAPQDSMFDSWGMYNRECVSYTAFKVYQSGRFMPWWGYNGNATDWTDNADAWGIPRDRNPRVGDVAITHNYMGHAMYVEAVNGRMVTVSQYNYPVNGQNGRWSMMTVSADDSGLGLMDFIHFQ